MKTIDTNIQKVNFSEQIQILHVIKEDIKEKELNINTENISNFFSTKNDLGITVLNKYVLVDMDLKRERDFYKKINEELRKR